MMQNDLAAIQIALRVLTAINERRSPEGDDLQELYRLAPPLQDRPANVRILASVGKSTKAGADLYAKDPRRPIDTTFEPAWPFSSPPSQPEPPPVELSRSRQTSWSPASTDKAE